MKKSKVEKNTNKKKRVLKILGIIAAILLVLYFVAKIFFINIYIKPNLKNYDISVSDLGTINNTTTSDYYSFDNFKLRNDFKEYKIVKEVEYDEETKSKSVALKNETKETAAIIGIRDSFYITDLNKFESFYLKLTGWNLKNEKDIILKSIEKYQKGFNIFDSFNSMIFASSNLINIFHQNNLSVFKLGELEGYVVESNNSFSGPKYKEIVVLKDKKTYYITLFNTSLENEQLIDFISTFVIE